MAERGTGVVYDARCVGHEPPGGLPADGLPAWAAVPPFDRPERLTSTRAVLEGSGVLAALIELPSRLASEGELALVHAEPYLSRLLEATASGARVSVGEQAWTGPGTHEAMLLAAGGVLSAVEAVLSGALANAFVLVRPPGHHAERDAGMGFCLVNNVAVGARWAQRAWGLGRVAIVDWEGLAGLPASFEHDPVGVDVPAGLSQLERDAVAAAEPAR